MSWIAPVNGGAYFGYTGPGYTEEFWILDVEGSRLGSRPNGRPRCPLRSSPSRAPSSTPCVSSRDGVGPLGLTDIERRLGLVLSGAETNEKGKRNPGFCLMGLGLIEDEAIPVSTAARVSTKGDRVEPCLVTRDLEV
jgi:hypothetical protein